MNKNNFILFSTLLLIVLFSFAQCKKEDVPLHVPLNITLYDKPLSTIQYYITGKWKVEYAKGGFCGTCIYLPRNNQYMQVNPDRIIFGNDSTGIVVDTAVIWERTKDIFGDSTYLLTYSYPPAYVFPITYVVDKIYNDTLVLIENHYDYITTYFTKIK